MVSRVESEYRAARSGAGWIRLSSRARLRVSGPDRSTFLHNLLSNDVASLTPGHGCYATLLTLQSRVVADMNVLCDDDAFLLDLEASVLRRAVEQLEHHLVADEVEIDDLGGAESTFGVCGPGAAGILARLTGETAPEAPLDHRLARVGGAAARVVRTSWTTDPGFDLWVAADGAEAVRAALLEAEGLVAIAADTFEILRVEAGVPQAGIDFDESHLVLEAGLERGIHFRKGCYLGQEIVERQAARGHVNRKRVGLRLEGVKVPQRAARVFDGSAEVGRLTSAVASPALAAPIAMGYVRREVMEPGTRLEVEVESTRVGAEVVALPFVDP